MSYCFCLSDIYVVKFSINNTQNRINRENFMQIPNWMLTNSVILRSSTSFIIHIAIAVIILVILFVYFVMSLKKATRYDEVHVSAVLKLKNNMARICISAVFFFEWKKRFNLFFCSLCPTLITQQRQQQKWAGILCDTVGENYFIWSKNNSSWSRKYNSK